MTESAVSRIIREKRERGEPLWSGCSYGTHSWVQRGSVGDLWMKRCTICDGVYQCSESEWLCLPESR